MINEKSLEDRALKYHVKAISKEEIIHALETGAKISASSWNPVSAAITSPESMSKEFNTKLKPYLLRFIQSYAGLCLVDRARVSKEMEES